MLPGVVSPPAPPSPSARVEWLEMKHLFAQMQKEQLRKLKAAVSMAPAGGKEKPKGFVPHTLVKVVCSGTVTAQTLKVRSVLWVWLQ